MSIRHRISAVFMTVGVWMAPSYAKPLASTMLKSFEGILAEICSGRTGGIVTAIWFKDEAGKALASFQQEKAMEAAKAARQTYSASSQP